MVKGNERINITAEFVSIMRANTDPKYGYFVSQKSWKIFNIIKSCLSKKRILSIFNQRLQLSTIFDQKVQTTVAKQIIELAAGYSLRGFNECLKNKGIVYIDVDFETVVAKKRAVLDRICNEERIAFPKNYFLVAADVLSDALFESIQAVATNDKKTLIIAEGLTSYFSEQNFNIFLKRVDMLLGSFKDAEFYSHETIGQRRGFIYFILRNIFVELLTKSKRRKSFSSKHEFEACLVSQGIRKYKLIDDGGYVVYSIWR